MIVGRVTTNREAVIELEIIGRNQETTSIEAVVDTGFNGYLTLPSNVISRLKFQLAGNRSVTLADSNVVILDAYLGSVAWHDQIREALILQADGEPLIGMSHFMEIM